MPTEKPFLDSAGRLASALDAVLGTRPLASWIEEYESAHQHPVNKALHLAGIPLVAASLPLLLIAPLFPRYWRLPAALFLLGWTAQLAGHVVEGRPPEFLKNWRFLLVGLRWWLGRIAAALPALRPGADPPSQAGPE